MTKFNATLTVVRQKDGKVSHGVVDLYDPSGEWVTGSRVDPTPKLPMYEMGFKLAERAAALHNGRVESFRKEAQA